MTKQYVPLMMNPRKAVLVETDATIGAVVGTNLFWPDGSVVTQAQLTASTGSTFTLNVAYALFVPLTRTVTGAMSVDGGGPLSADIVLTLENDSAAPGGGKVYGTNAAGVRGWQDALGSGRAFILPQDGEDGMMGVPGLAGADGPTGPAGPAGAGGTGQTAFILPQDGEDGMMGVPGVPGGPGPTGPAGADGSGQTAFILPQDGEDGMMGVPGTTGPIGPTGPAGADGTGGGQTIFILPQDGEDGMMGVPGAAAVAGSSAAGNIVELTIAQVAHGFSVGMPIHLNLAIWEQADRDAATSVADMIVSVVSDADNFKATPMGQLTLTTGEWDARTGDVGGLTAGEYYWLSSTAGGITKTKPDTGLVQLCLAAITATVALVWVGDVVDVTPAAPWVPLSLAAGITLAMPASTGLYVPDRYEIGLGAIFEITSGSVLEIG